MPNHFELNKALKKINILESSLDKEDFDEKFADFFTDACTFLKIPDHSQKSILELKRIDPFLIDSIIWKYLYTFGLGLKMRDYKCFDFDKKSSRKNLSNLSLFVEPLESFGDINYLPSSEVILSKSAYVFIGHQPYLLTLTKENHLAHEEDDFYSEQKWAEKETSILIGLINLSIQYGSCNFFTGNNAFYVPITSYLGNISELSSEVIDDIKEKIELYEFVYSRTRHETTSVRKEFDYIRGVDLKKVKMLNKKVDRGNSTLIRCLYNFAKACAYAPHRMMMEESTALQMFCLDGLTKLFMKKYKIKKVSELGRFIKKEFLCPYGDYLSELYDERTIYVHPSNIHGEYWCPPWDADTCLDTLPVVRDMLCFYLTGEFHFSDPRWEHSIEEMKDDTEG